MHYRIATALATVALTTALAAAPALAKVKAGKPVQYAGEATIAQVATLVQPAGKGDFSTVKRIVIPYFQLEVQTKAGKNESSKAFMSNMTANASITYKIVGLEPVALQALTDRLYAAVIEDFQAKGITVLDRAEARSKSANYAKLEAAMKPGPDGFRPKGGGKAMIYSPTGLGLYYAGVENADPTGGAGMFGGFAAMAKGFSGMGATMAEALAPTELDAALVGIRLKIVFVQTSGWKASGMVSVSGKTAVSVSPLDSQLWIMAPKSQAKSNGRAQYQLAAPLVPPANPVVSTEDTTSTGKKIDTMVGNLIGGLSGTSSYKARDYTVTVDPRAFDATMSETLAGTQRMLVNRMTMATR